MASGAQALPGVGGLQGTTDAGLVEKTPVVCPRPYWNGWRWVPPVPAGICAARLLALCVWWSARRRGAAVAAAPIFPTDRRSLI